MAAVDQGCTGIAMDGDAHRLRDFHVADTEFHCWGGLHGDAAVTVRGHGHRQRDQFARLGVKMSGFRAGEQRCPLQRVGSARCELREARIDLVPLLPPVEHDSPS